MNRIADLRSTITTLEDADAAFREFALAEKRIAAADARFERDEAKRRAAHAERTLSDRKLSDAIKSRLAAFIDNNRALFKRPRTRKTEQGKYGLRTATELVIMAEDLLFDHLLERGYEDCFTTVRRPVKTAIRDRMIAGEHIPGCTINTGDTVVCKPFKSFLDEARQEATE